MPTPTPFAQPVNDYHAVLTGPHPAGAATLDLPTGMGLALGPLRPDRFYRVSALENVDTPDEVCLAILEASGLAGDTLTGIVGAEGYANVALPVGTAIQVRMTAKDQAEVQDAVNALEIEVAGLPSGPQGPVGPAGHGITVTVSSGQPSGPSVGDVWIVP